MATQETQVGVAKIFAFLKADGTVAAAMAPLTGAATVTMENADFEHKFKMDESKGMDGNVETLFGSDEQYDISINFTPTAATRAGAIAQGETLIPAKLSKVTLSGFSLSKYNGDFNYVGGATIKLVRDKECVVGLKLRSWVGSRDMGT